MGHLADNVLRVLDPEQIGPCGSASLGSASTAAIGVVDGSGTD